MHVCFILHGARFIFSNRVVCKIYLPKGPRIDIVFGVFVCLGFGVFFQEQKPFSLIVFCLIINTTHDIICIDLLHATPASFLPLIKRKPFYLTKKKYELIINGLVYLQVSDMHFCYEFQLFEDINIYRLDRYRKVPLHVESISLLNIAVLSVENFRFRNCIQVILIYSLTIQLDQK